jgi:hypothetical protein
MTLSEFACTEIAAWLSLATTYGTAQPSVIIYSDGVEIPRQAIVISATSADQTAQTVAVEISLMLDQADFTDAAHRESAAALRYRLCPAAPRYEPGAVVISCHPDFFAWAQARPGGRVFDLLAQTENHTAQDGRLIYLLEVSAVVMLQ